MADVKPPSPAPAPAPAGIGAGTILLGGVLTAAAFFGYKKWAERQAPSPEAVYEPGRPSGALAKPDALPGGPKASDAPEAPPGDSLSMIKTADDFKGVAGRGLIANARPEPPLVYTGDRGPAKAGTRVMRTRKEWDALWAETGGHDMPPVDFEKYMGLAVFAGERPAGTRVELTASAGAGGRVEARWRVVAPKEPEAGVTRPFAAVLAPRNSAQPVFRELR